MIPLVIDNPDYMSDSDDEKQSDRVSPPDRRSLPTKAASTPKTVKAASKRKGGKAASRRKGGKAASSRKGGKAAAKRKAAEAISDTEHASDFEDNEADSDFKPSDAEASPELEKTKPVSEPKEADVTAGEVRSSPDADENGGDVSAHHNESSAPNSPHAGSDVIMDDAVLDKAPAPQHKARTTRHSGSHSPERDMDAGVSDGPDDVAGDALRHLQNANADNVTMSIAVNTQDTGA